MKKYKIREYSIAWWTVNVLKGMMALASCMSIYLLFYILGC